ncbi:hypothetical protein SCHPADRAFT_905021 [Schizopora paradoxa]|uniref:Uncharacterized protein n=1 Tax=Schizopora paradoxa TaxID=27342 RepID=A0A0H2S6N4_9AGAM|nr:hypothetical protein SCHPADRAFT_905021 [Schizopora paradoxa]
MVIDESMEVDDGSMVDQYDPEEIATKVMLMEPSHEDEDSDGDVDYNPAADEDMEEDSESDESDNTMSSGGCEEFNFEEEIDIKAPSSKPVPPIDYEGIMKAYDADNQKQEKEGEEEEAEFSDSEDDHSSSASSDEFEETYKPEDVSTAVMLQEPDEDDDADDSGFSPKRIGPKDVVGNPHAWNAEVDRITASTKRL